jgi:SAM-dependent methyltransferase
MKPANSYSDLQFYNALASDYHLLFADWFQAVERQSKVLDDLICASLGRRPASLLDCTCGIGTQAIGLALRGYDVHATDLSPAAVERARKEAAKLGASLTFGVADVRILATQVPGTFEAIIACDNSLPHLLSDEDLGQASRNVYSKLARPGLYLACIRDYDQLAADKPRFASPRVFDDAQGKRIVFQVWDWSEDGSTYLVRQFILRQAENDWKTKHYATRYQVLQRSQLTRFLSCAGFSEIEWQMPAESGYYQPVVRAYRQ